VSGDEVPKKLKQNINTAHIFTLMVAFGMEQFMMLPLKWGTITKLGVCLSLKPSLDMMQLGEQMPTGNRRRLKVNTLATSLSSLY